MKSVWQNMWDNIKSADNDCQIYDLWSKSFGDTKEDIEFFLNNCRHKICVGYYKNGNLLSMLFLVDCKAGGVNGKYVYAACTSESSRGCGYMSEILDFCSRNYSNIFLIPADDNLVDYYSKRGFTEKIAIEDISFSETDEIKEYLLEGYSLSEPCALMCKGV